MNIHEKQGSHRQGSRGRGHVFVLGVAQVRGQGPGSAAAVHPAHGGGPGGGWGGRAGQAHGGGGSGAGQAQRRRREAGVGRGQRQHGQVAHGFTGRHGERKIHIDLIFFCFLAQQACRKIPREAGSRDWAQSSTGRVNGNISFCQRMQIHLEQKDRASKPTSYLLHSQTSSRSGTTWPRPQEAARSQ